RTLYPWFYFLGGGGWGYRWRDWRTDDHEFHAHQRDGRDQRGDQRHELHWGHGSDVQRGERELHCELGHGDSGDGAGGGHYGTTERDHARGHGCQREQLHGNHPAAGGHAQLQPGWRDLHGVGDRNHQ